MPEIDWTAINVVVTWAAIAVSFLVKAGRSMGEKDSTMIAKLAEIERRLDAAGKRMSDLATRIQTLPGTTSLMQRELEILQRDHDSTIEMLGLLRERLARIEGRQSTSGDGR